MARERAGAEEGVVDQKWQVDLTASKNANMLFRISKVRGFG